MVDAYSDFLITNLDPSQPVEASPSLEELEARADPWAPGTLWFPCRHIPGNDAGSYFGDPAELIVLHTTEGPTLDGAVAALRARNAWPHFTLDPRDGNVVQHLPLNRTARTLASPGGRQSPNRSGTRIIQIEQVGFTSQVGTWPNASYARVRNLVHKIARAAGIPLRRAFPWTGGRVSWETWRHGKGLCGHMHAPLNDHIDPGAGYRIEKLLAGAGPQPDPNAYPGTPLRRGSTGPHVRKVQGWLNKVRNVRNQPKLAVDGDFGPATERRVRQFQRNHRLAVDGVVGPNTWRALRRAATEERRRRQRRARAPRAGSGRGRGADRLAPGRRTTWGG